MGLYTRGVTCESILKTLFSLENTLYLCRTHFSPILSIRLSGGYTKISSNFGGLYSRGLYSDLYSTFSSIRLVSFSMKDKSFSPALIIVWSLLIFWASCLVAFPIIPSNFLLKETVMVGILVKSNPPRFTSPRRRNQFTVFSKIETPLWCILKK